MDFLGVCDLSVGEDHDVKTILTKENLLFFREVTIKGVVMKILVLTFIALVQFLSMSAFAVDEGSFCIGEGKVVGNKGRVTHCLCGTVLYRPGDPANPCPAKYMAKLKASNPDEQLASLDTQTILSKLASPLEVASVPEICTIELPPQEIDRLAPSMIKIEAKIASPAAPVVRPVTIYTKLGNSIIDEMKQDPRIPCPSATKAKTELIELCKKSLEDKTYEKIETSRFRSGSRHCSFNTGYDQYYTATDSFTDNDTYMQQGLKENAIGCFKFKRNDSVRGKGFFIIEKSCTGHSRWTEKPTLSTGDMFFVNLAPNVLLLCIANDKVFTAGLIIGN